jgi:hypothetical protein
MTRSIAVILLLFSLVGCAPRARLTFPYRRLIATTQPQSFDCDGDGRNDFAVTFDKSGRLDAVAYDDGEDGKFDRVYRLADYANEDVPHLILLLDSIPFQMAADRYAGGEFRWFDPPTKVIAPFPSLTEICYGQLLAGAPMPGMVAQYYDPRKRRLHDGLWDRGVMGNLYPWEQYLDYRSGSKEEGLTYLDPQKWYHAELERARRAFDDSPNRTTIVYLTSASGMACKYGREGIDQVLDGAARLCLQLLYERHGAIKISMMADHGHNLVTSKNIDVGELLRRAGFNVATYIQKPSDVVLEAYGLVTYAAVRTTEPKRVTAALLTSEGVDMACYLDGGHVAVCDNRGCATIDARGPEKLRYRATTSDVLKLEPVIALLREKGKLDADGFATRDDWFAATVDHEYPDAPARLWDAFHRLVVNPPEVMFTARDGYTAGLPSFERFITMKSTHGSLNQINTATFLMTMTGRAKAPLRTRDVIRTIAPDFAIPTIRSAR